MSALAIILIVIAAGIAGFLIYAGQALLEWASRSRHRHKWSVLATLHEFDAPDDSSVVTTFVLRCSECGEIIQRGGA